MFRLQPVQIFPARQLKRFHHGDTETKNVERDFLGREQNNILRSEVSMILLVCSVSSTRFLHLISVPSVSPW